MARMESEALNLISEDPAIDRGRTKTGVSAKHSIRQLSRMAPPPSAENSKRLSRTALGERTAIDCVAAGMWRRAPRAAALHCPPQSGALAACCRAARRQAA